MVPRRHFFQVCCTRRPSGTCPSLHVRRAGSLVFASLARIVAFGRALTCRLHCTHSHFVMNSHWKPSTSPAMVGTSLGDVAGSILDAQLPAGAPILARRRGPEKRLAEAKAEEEEAKAVAQAKKALKSQAHRALRSTAATDPVLETMLRKTATQGVVSLFNAVRAAQQDSSDDGR